MTTLVGSKRIPRARPRPLDGGDWPHTNRFMPWLLAGFLGMLFLIPFDHMFVPGATFVDAKLDRFLLTAVLIAWVASVLSKRSEGPRFARNRMAAPVLLFMFVALASVAVNVELLTRVELLGLTIKKLALLLSWVLLLFMVVTTVRPSEVRNFGKLIVGLATITAIGTIWEYRTEFNAFWAWSDALIPFFRSDDQIKVIAYDSTGRRMIAGPASHGLAVVTLMSLALPFALTELIHGKSTRDKVMYAAAMCILFAGTFATARKTSVFVPLGAALVFLAYRPRQMIRWAPLLIVLIPAIHVMAPEALGSIRNQLFPKEGFLNQNSVEGRTDDYEAVKPDIRAHMVLGTGYGAYDHEVFRLLDNQYLITTIETGFIGLASYFLLMLAVPWVAHRVIRFGDPSRAPPALAASAAAMGFLVANALFDTLAFGHVPYTFFFVAGMAAVLASEPLPERVRSRVGPLTGRPRMTPDAGPAGAMTTMRRG